MRHLGAIILSHEQGDDLSHLLSWKGLSLEHLETMIADTEQDISGFLLLSTCNRVEIIYSIENPQDHRAFYESLLRRLPVVEGPAPVFKTGRPVARHLLRLSAGLESMVLGETDIRHQMKEAKAEAIRAGHLDYRLRTILQGVFKHSRYIRSFIPANLPLSVSSLAVRFLEESLGGLDSSEDGIAIIGSGPMSRHTAEYLSKWGARNIVWINRTEEKIASLAENLGAQTLGLQDFLADPQKAGRLRAIVTATSSEKPIIDSLLVRSLNRSGPLTLVDLALPQDVDPDVSDHGDVELISLDRIRQRLEANRKQREEAAARAESAVEECLFRLESELIHSLSGPILKELQKDIRNQAQQKLQGLLQGRLAHLNARDRRILYDWAIRSHREMNRIHRSGVEQILKNYFMEA
ncbi:MAG: NAD(P)-binding domain-containing protein [Leptospiraceae bacterium]|nr:NAD(P)-binding domain-containing protein [Leptospiraceae bacterium]